MKILVTGGAGFIGSALCRYLIKETDHYVVNLDALTYAGDLSTVAEIASHERYTFVKDDIRDEDALNDVFERYQPDAVMHLAAESHVDRSIDGPDHFIQTNIVGTYNLLQSARKYWDGLAAGRKSSFRFHHISTDEVYGSLGEAGAFTEDMAYEPNSPYSASKAASDHLVRAWNHTFGLPVVISNCSNNYGPYQFPEKLIPLVILNALNGQSLPIYGRGENIRDWLHVEDHARALYCVLTQGEVGQKYNIGGNAERKNIDVVRSICEILDDLYPDSTYAPHEDLIKFVKDRPGHDMRYAIDASKIKNELGWYPEEKFEEGLRKTVQWYVENMDWAEKISRGTYIERRGNAGLSDKNKFR